ncbi:penicillin-binding transpeptidase domain-containing protein [Robertmurraya korlensis]|uniref:penicillin-binding transpeptidase domain-containing protein n=1 Tax=Robertmurraya korlensis TaxID=519977 RepID=UPI0008269927|nr:penicillin-binding transpeptidase domain-containing protein [Robertmurraya korlensis]
MKKSLWLFIIFVLFILTSCNKEPQPEDRFSTYVKLWNDQKFEEMYSYLSDKAKDSIKKDEFVERYKKIYNDLGITNLKVTYEKPAEEKERDKKVTEASLPFAVSMDSIAGEISFEHDARLTKEEREDNTNWYLNWDTTYIFPDLKEGNKVGINTTTPKRGDILDRNGLELATTGTALEMGIVPKEIEGQEAAVIEQLSAVLGMSKESIEKALNASWVKPDYFVPLKTISEANTELRAQLGQIPGVQRKTVEARVYPFGEAAAHLIGYVGAITAEELEKQEPGTYSSNDVIGKRGLEQVLEKRLKGESGVQILIQKEDGTETVLAEKPVKEGENVKLTIDGAVQKDMHIELQGEAGMGTAVHPTTGETLALVSSPSFDPNKLSLGATAADWKALEEDPKQPLLNRFKANYAPGSVIKPITAAIALQAGTTDWEKTMQLSGKQWQKDSSWGSYYVTRVTDPNAPVNLADALLYSDNVYFAQTALDLGKEPFEQGLKAYGFEEESDFLFPLEMSTFGDMSSEVTLADSGYGQGQVEMSVLHLASTYTMLMNNGNMIKPTLLLDDEDSQVWKPGLLDEENVTRLNEALKQVVEHPRGTANAAKMEGFPLAGKTGTAEFKEKQNQAGKENGWFVAYNTDNPSLLVAMMIENVEGRGGSKVVVEKVKRVFQTE